MMSIYIGVSHSYTKQGGTLVSYVLTSNNNLFQPIRSYVKVEGQGPSAKGQGHRDGTLPFEGRVISQKLSHRQFFFIDTS